MIKWVNHFNDVFELIFEHSLIGMAILDCNGKFIRINPKACEIWEFTEEELIGKHWKDITHPEDLEKSTYFMEIYNNKSTNFNMVLEKRYISGMGKIKCCKVTTSALRNSEGSIELFASQIFDITKKKEAIESINKGLELLQELKNKQPVISS